jgi:hypothetical protein
MNDIPLTTTNIILSLSFLQYSGGRPETEIKKVLQEIAIYHRSGEQKNTWELKKEYQGGAGK